MSKCAYIEIQDAVSSLLHSEGMCTDAIGTKACHGVVASSCAHESLSVNDEAVALCPPSKS